MSLPADQCHVICRLETMRRINRDPGGDCLIGLEGDQGRNLWMEG